jgi:hypothetical protein
MSESFLYNVIFIVMFFFEVSGLIMLKALFLWIGVLVFFYVAECERIICKSTLFQDHLYTLIQLVTISILDNHKYNK